MSQPTGIYNIFQKLATADMNSKKVKKKPVKPVAQLIAYCKRLTNRNTTVGNTLFKFDENGRTSVPDLGNNRLDYNVLLRMNGVTLER